MKRLNIALITYDWPPRNAMSVHRPYYIAKYFSEYGINIIVITSEKMNFDGPLDLDLPAIKNTKVVEVSYRSAINSISNFTTFLRMGRKLKYFLAKFFGHFIDPRKGWYIEALELVKKIASETDCVISFYGPASAHLLAYEMKLKNPNIFWVADYRDMWSLLHTLDVSEKTRKKIKELEQKIVGNYADLITTVSNEHAKRLKDFLNKPSICIYNGFPFEEEEVYKLINEKYITNRKSKKLRIVYTGFIEPKTRNPEPILKSLVYLLNKKLIKQNDIVIEFYGSKIDFVVKLSKNKIYSPFILIKGHLPWSDVIKVQREADVLLLIESDKSDAAGVVTGKLFEYLAAGKPILAIGNENSEIAEILKKTGTGIVFSPCNLEGISQILLKTLHGEGLFNIYKPNFEKIMLYSRKSNSLLLLNYILKNLSEKQRC